VIGVEREGKKYEEYAYVLDDLPHGRPGTNRPVYHARGIIQIIGETFFTLLEAEPQREATFTIRERIYVGKAGRTKVAHILGRIAYGELTSQAKSELPSVIETIIRSDEKRFIDFFNSSQPVTPRMHAMELVPGIGKKLMWQILDQREKQPFKDFQDLQGRVNLTDPVKLLARRVLKELSEEEKYLIFTRPM
jgi:putative nucleotide binding protein